MKIILTVAAALTLGACDYICPDNRERVYLAMETKEQTLNPGGMYKGISDREVRQRAQAHVDSALMALKELKARGYDAGVTDDEDFYVGVRDGLDSDYKYKVVATKTATLE